MKKQNVKNLIIGAATFGIMNSGAWAATTVNLGTAGNYTILSKAGISTTPGTFIDGNIGVSPIATSAITGFDLSPGDPTTVPFSTSALVGGHVFGADNLAPTPSLLGVAIGDMETAYTDAAGRSDPDFLNLDSGNLNSTTPDLAAGLYKWASAVTITDSVTFNGGGDSNAIWVMQVDNRLSLETGANIILSGGAQAQNIFWQTAEGATLGTNSHFEGILLTATDIAVQTDASVNGNLYAQTAVTLDSNDIAQAIPEPSTVALLGLGGLGMLFARRRTT